MRIRELDRFELGERVALEFLWQPLAACGPDEEFIPLVQGKVTR